MVLAVVAVHAVATDLMQIRKARKARYSAFGERQQRMVAQLKREALEATGEESVAIDAALTALRQRQHAGWSPSASRIEPVIKPAVVLDGDAASIGLEPIAGEGMGMLNGSDSATSSHSTSSS